MENLGVAMSCARDGQGLPMRTASRRPLASGARSHSAVKLGCPQQRGLGSPSPHPKSDAAGGPRLQVEAVRPVPVAVDDVHAAVAVEVGQRHAASVLVGVIQPCEQQGDGETGPSLLLSPRDTPGDVALWSPISAISHPLQSAGLSVPVSPPPGVVPAVPLLTHGSCHVPVRPVPPVVEEEIGAVLVTAEYVGGTVAQDGAHGHPTAPWGQQPGVRGPPCPRGVRAPVPVPVLLGPPAPPPCPSPSFSPSHQELIGAGSHLCHFQPNHCHRHGDNTPN